MFIINQQRISLSTGQTSADKYYLKASAHNGLELCINNNSDSTIVVHEICHIDPNCPLCPDDSGEIVFMSRAEIQSVVISGTLLCTHSDINTTAMIIYSFRKWIKCYYDI